MGCGCMGCPWTLTSEEAGERFGDLGYLARVPRRRNQRMETVVMVMAVKRVRSLGHVLSDV